MGHHQMVRKSSFYDEAARVPLLLSWPGHIVEDKTDKVNLASGMDIMPTLCDYAGIKPPPDTRGLSLRSILEGGNGTLRQFVVTEANSNTGRMLRTQDFKYIKYVDDPVEQLFDMKNDPGETRNLASDSYYTPVLAKHRRLLDHHEARLDAPGDIPHAEFWRKGV
jgi:choline-sulfatase